MTYFLSYLRMAPNLTALVSLQFMKKEGPYNLYQLIMGLVYWAYSA